MLRLKITRDGIIRRPDSWFARPAFELAIDVASITSENPEKVLNDILQKGAIQYLEEIFENNHEIFKKISKKKKLYKVASLKKSDLPKEYSIRLLLESYGILTPPMISSEIRKHITSFLDELKFFKTDYLKLEELLLVDKISTLLVKSRTCFERLLKEWLFILISLILFYEDSISRGFSENIFILDRPIFHIWPYDREHELEKIVRKYKEFLEKVGSNEFTVSADLKRKIKKYLEKKKVEFTLNDWYSLVKISIEYINRNYKDSFWRALPEYFYQDVHVTIRELEKFFSKEKALKWLNIGSHEEAMVKLRENIDNRKEVLNIIMKLDEKVSLILQRLPELITIIEKVAEARTGLEYYSAERLSDKTSLKIYGPKIELEFLYYIIPRTRKADKIATYPILITNLVDSIF